MTTRRVTLSTVVLSLALLTSAAHAGDPVASNLTGTYEGSFTCKQTGAYGEKVPVRMVHSVLRIAQVTTHPNGSFLDVTIDDVPYSARTIDVNGMNSGKGVGVFVFCGGDDDAWAGDTEVERFTFKVNATKGTGTIKKSGLYNYTMGEAGGGSLGSCKGSWKRTSTDVPAIAISCGIPAP